jgi:ankyrin repeat protein
LKVDPDGIEEKLVSISDLPFIPDVSGKTPIHESLANNNTSMTDILINNLKNADFDHHSRYLI